MMNNSRVSHVVLNSVGLLHVKKHDVLHKIVSCEEMAFIKRSVCHHLWPPILLRDLKTTIFSVKPKFILLNS